MPWAQSVGAAGRVAARLLLASAIAAPVQAQTVARLYAGAGIASVADQAPRVVLGALEAGDSSGALAVDGGVFVTPRVAIGAEFFRLTGVDTSTSGHFGTASKSDDEFTITGDVRAVLVRSRRAEVTAVGGVGTTRATATETRVPLDPRSSPFTMSDARTVLTWSAGADLMFTPLRHLLVGPVVRVQWLRGTPSSSTLMRRENPSATELASTRFVLGAMLRGAW